MVKRLTHNHFSFLTPDQRKRLMQIRWELWTLKRQLAEIRGDQPAPDPFGIIRDEDNQRSEGTSFSGI